MKNPNIGRVLKYYRKLRKLTVCEVSEKLQAQNLKVAVKTIYGWESGHTQPDADTLLLLCEIYNIENILDTFGYSNSDTELLHLTEHEKKLIIEYRNQYEMQAAVNKLLDLS